MHKFFTKVPLKTVRDNTDRKSRDILNIQLAISDLVAYVNKKKKMFKWGHCMGDMGCTTISNKDGLHLQI